MAFRFKTDQLSLGANASGTATFSVSAGKTMTLKKLTWNSTGAFNVNSIRDTASGEDYTTGDIVSTTFEDKDAENTVTFDPSPEFSGSTTLAIKVTDTSGAANTVDLTIWVDER